jgi:hypothetical protein
MENDIWETLIQMGLAYDPFDSKDGTFLEYIYIYYLFDCNWVLARWQ